jgi:hypothetical protein
MLLFVPRSWPPIGGAHFSRGFDPGEDSTAASLHWNWRRAFPPCARTKDNANFVSSLTTIPRD